ncbi:hypothetical protein RC83_13340 [Pectobacterium brasiliense]|nr:hypothetical protein RC83_13340 [Pectobacterium brasiliense]
MTPILDLKLLRRKRKPKTQPRMPLTTTVVMLLMVGLMKYLKCVGGEIKQLSIQVGLRPRDEEDKNNCDMICDYQLADI